MNAKPFDIDWAYIVDLFASEYGWTIDQIKELDMGQVMSLVDAMKKRHNANSGDDGIPQEMNNEEVSVHKLESDLKGKRTIREDGKTVIEI